jgi:hypothetical protein
MIRRVGIGIALVVVGLLALTGGAVAGSLPAANSGSIAVYVPATAGAAATQPRYQGPVAFNTAGTARLKNPRVWVACDQGGTMVYGEGGSPAETLKLGGDMSQWVVNGGGAADCTVSLYYILNAKLTGEWNGSGAQGGTVVLGATSFSATS